MEPVGKAALIASVGGARGYADWTKPDHRLRRLLSEFMGMAGLTFILSGGAAILVEYGGRALQPWQTVLVPRWSRHCGWSSPSTSWATSRPTSTRPPPWRSHCAVTWAGSWPGSTGRPVRRCYLRVLAGAGLLRCGRQPSRHHPKPGKSWQAAGFEAIITFGLVLMVLNLANGPKLNGPFIPLAVGAYILGWGTMGGPFDGASMNPARSFGRRSHRQPVHLVGLSDRAGSRRGHRRRRRLRPARAG